MEIKSDTQIDLGKISAKVLDKVKKVEHEERYTAFLGLQTFNHTIWVLNAQFISNNGNAIAFQSLNLYQKDTHHYVFNMQDGKVYGFDTADIPEVFGIPEAFIEAVLTELFVIGWD